jgi:hypothetical protein
MPITAPHLLSQNFHANSAWLQRAALDHNVLRRPRSSTTSTSRINSSSAACTPDTCRSRGRPVNGSGTADRPFIRRHRVIPHPMQTSPPACPSRSPRPGAPRPDAPSRGDCGTLHQHRHRTLTSPSTEQRPKAANPATQVIPSFIPSTTGLSGTLRDGERLNARSRDAGRRCRTLWDSSELTLNPQVLGSKPRGRTTK